LSYVQGGLPRPPGLQLPFVPNSSLFLKARARRKKTAPFVGAGRWLTCAAPCHGRRRHAVIAAWRKRQDTRSKRVGDAFRLRFDLLEARW